MSECMLEFCLVFKVEFVQMNVCEQIVVFYNDIVVDGGIFLDLIVLLLIDLRCIEI